MMPSKQTKTPGFYLRLMLLFFLAALFCFEPLASTVKAFSEEQKRLYANNILYYDLDACGAVSAPSTGGEVSGNVQDLAKEMLENDKITYWTNNGVNTRDVVVALSKGKKAPISAGNANNRETDMNPNILKFIIEAAKSGKIMVNALSDKNHTSGSNHYKGKAVDLDINPGNTSVSVNKLISIGKKYGGTKNSETTHHHFDFTGGAEGGSEPAATSETSGGGCVCGGGDTELVGSENAEKIFNFFVGKGYKPFQAAGIMGNMKAESGLNPRALQPGTTGDAPIAGRGFGLVQWTFPDRQQPLVAKARQAGKKASDLGIQLEYVIDELNSDKFQGVGDAFKRTTNVEEATLLIELRYEIHAGGVQPQRTADAKKFLAKYGSGAGGTSGSDSTACSEEGGAVTGEYALPVDKKWYNSNPEWFTKPHHDYPASDIPVPQGTKIYSMTAGKVIKAPTGGACGVGVIIDTKDGIRYTYCHGTDGGSISSAKQGDTVKAGQTIMHSGNTGSSRGAHLHVQIAVNGQNRCPQKLLVGIAKGNPVSEKSLPSSGCTN